MSRRLVTSRPRLLGEAEQHVMDFVWAHGPVTAEACREGVKDVWPMKDSTMRTVLSRLETKGYLTHAVDGRTYLYSAAVAPTAVAGRTVKHVIERFCGGSAEALLLGLVDAEVVSPQQLERLAKKIAREREKGRS